MDSLSRYANQNRAFSLRAIVGSYNDLKSIELKKGVVTREDMYNSFLLGQNDLDHPALEAHYQLMFEACYVPVSSETFRMKPDVARTYESFVRELIDVLYKRIGGVECPTVKTFKNDTVTFLMDMQSTGKSFSQSSPSAVPKGDGAYYSRDSQQPYSHPFQRAQQQQQYSHYGNGGNPSPYSQHGGHGAGDDLDRNEAVVRFLAQVRKGGMDILSPQGVHDKALACIYFAMKCPAVAPMIHRDLIEIVVAVIDQNLLSQMNVVSKTKVRGVVALIKHAGTIFVHGSELDQGNLVLSPEVRSFRDFRQRHDAFLMRFAQERNVYMSTSARAEVVWMFDEESTRRRLEAIEKLGSVLLPFFEAYGKKRPPRHAHHRDPMHNVDEGSIFFLESKPMSSFGGSMHSDITGSGDFGFSSESSIHSRSSAGRGVGSMLTNNNEFDLEGPIQGYRSGAGYDSMGAGAGRGGVNQLPNFTGSLPPTRMAPQQALAYERGSASLPPSSSRDRYPGEPPRSFPGNMNYDPRARPPGPPMNSADGPYGRQYSASGPAAFRGGEYSRGDPRGDPRGGAYYNDMPRGPRPGYNQQQGGYYPDERSGRDAGYDLHNNDSYRYPPRDGYYDDPRGFAGRGAPGAAYPKGDYPDMHKYPDAGRGYGGERSHFPQGLHSSSRVTAFTQQRANGGFPDRVDRPDKQFDYLDSGLGGLSLGGEPRGRSELLNTDPWSSQGASGGSILADPSPSAAVGSSASLSASAAPWTPPTASASSPSAHTTVGGPSSSGLLVIPPTTESQAPHATATTAAHVAGLRAMSNMSMDSMGISAGSNNSSFFGNLAGVNALLDDTAPLESLDNTVFELAPAAQAEPETSVEVDGEPASASTAAVISSALSASSHHSNDSAASSASEKQATQQPPQKERALSLVNGDGASLDAIIDLDELE